MKIILMIITIIIVSVIVIQCSHNLMSFYARDGIDPSFIIEDPHYVFKSFPGKLDYEGPLIIAGEKQLYGSMLFYGVYKVWANDEWLIGFGNNNNKETKSYFAIKKFDELENREFLDYDEADELISSRAIFPIETLDELSQVVGFDTSSIVFLEKMNEENYRYYQKAKAFHRKIVWLTLSLSSVLILLVFGRSKQVSSR